MNWQALLSTERIRISDKKDIRNAIESDLGRITFSPALRRMHDKTQVFPLTTDDNIHSRLTHSNEVMSIGYTFGLYLSESSIIQAKTGKTEAELLREMVPLMQSICLVHDIGNAPFGHFGETIISQYFDQINKGNPPTSTDEGYYKKFKEFSPEQKFDFLHYDGNAQGLRVLTKLQYLDNPFGLNLTYATLAASLKYPNYSGIDKSRLETKKHGVFFSEIEFFKKIISKCELVSGEDILRHPLCYLMEAADSIAYLTMDLEDGYNKGLISLDDIKKTISNINTSPGDQKTRFPKERMLETLNDNEVNDNTKIVMARIELIGFLVKLAYENFEKNLDKIEEGKYNHELIDDDIYEVQLALRKLSGKVFLSREINYLETTGYSVITGLLDFYIKFLFHPNEKFLQRAKRLISKSVIECAIHETLIDCCKSKINTGIAKLEEELNVASSDSKRKKLKEEIESFNKIKAEVEPIYEEYQLLFERQMAPNVTLQDKNALKAKTAFLKSKVKPGFEDLADYYKFRVILDFISGMTDQFALTHFQKISGQRIS